jgi:hypothetical protein
LEKERKSTLNKQLETLTEIGMLETGQNNRTRLFKGATIEKRQILGAPTVVLLRDVIVPGAIVASPSRHTKHR